MAVQNSTFAATVGGAATAIFMWAVQSLGHPIPADIATAVTTIIMALITHFVPDTAASTPPPANMKPAE